MLVLSRKNQESVVVGGADGVHRLLRVKVLEIRGANVRLGFEVDADIPVHRSEARERIQAGTGQIARCLVVSRPGSRKGRANRAGNCSETAKKALKHVIGK